jgi:hypothetical protein
MQGQVNLLFIKLFHQNFRLLRLRYSPLLRRRQLHPGHRERYLLLNALADHELHGRRRDRANRDGRCGRTHICGTSDKKQILSAGKERVLIKSLSKK